MFTPKIKKEGQAALGGVLMLVLLIGIVILIFSLIQRPEEPPVPPPPATDFTGLPDAALEAAEAEAEDREQNFPIVQVLPYGGPFDGEPFAIYPPTNEGRMFIFIDSAVDFEEIKGTALDWINDQGYNPADYDIQFKTRQF